MGYFQWGRRAKVYAAASAYIAAREREKDLKLAQLSVSTRNDFFR